MNTNDFELENMRQQMTTLKNKLDQQEIVSDRLIRRSMRDTAGNITRRYYLIMALCVLVIPYTYVVFVMNLGLSLAFWIGTSIFMLVCGGATYYNCLNVTSANMMSDNLIGVGKKMARAKKFDANWLFFGIPAVILWLAWLVWELYQLDADAARYSLYGVVCGAIVGAVFGIKIHTRTLRQYQDIIDQIDDIAKD
ncbi:MAG: hypothetical protein II886_05685 [Prevotella sp.]|nr:hypothetical protein [Prevotella sp.]